MLIRWGVPQSAMAGQVEKWAASCSRTQTHHPQSFLQPVGWHFPNWPPEVKATLRSPGVFVFQVSTRTPFSHALQNTGLHLCQLGGGGYKVHRDLFGSNGVTCLIWGLLAVSSQASPPPHLSL